MRLARTIGSAAVALAALAGGFTAGMNGVAPSTALHGNRLACTFVEMAVESRAMTRADAQDTVEQLVKATNQTARERHRSTKPLDGERLKHQLLDDCA